MLKTILEIIEKHPKHYSKIIAKDVVLLAWVNENNKASTENFAAKIYSAITNSNNICQNNQTKRFINISKGWGFCGRTSNCQCAAISLSEKCKQSSKEKDWVKIIDKRRQTNIKKYGKIIMSK